MTPIGLLMIEHRLIERMVAPLGACIERMDATGEMDPVFLGTAVDFIRSYADRCHHGKEEDILFRDLKSKPLTDEHRRIMDELIAEHVYGRKTVGLIVEARQRYLDGDGEAVRTVMQGLGELIGFYPGHIEKEDKHFFRPAMAYFTEAQQQRMLQECHEFDRTLVHEHYRDVMAAMEAAMGQ